MPSQIQNWNVKYSVSIERKSFLIIRWRLKILPHRSSNWGRTLITDTKPWRGLVRTADFISSFQSFISHSSWSRPEWITHYKGHFWPFAGSLWHKNGFHAGKGSIIGAGVRNIINPTHNRFFLCKPTYYSVFIRISDLECTTLVSAHQEGLIDRESHETVFTRAGVSRLPTCKISQDEWLCSAKNTESNQRRLLGKTLILEGPR